MSFRADLSQYSEPELQRWLHLRAIEWCAWPVFLSQPLLPALLVAFSPVPLIIAVIIAEFLWRFVRYSFVSPRLANAGASFVIVAKWPLAISAAICLILQHRYSVAVLAIVWPLIASLASVPATLIAALFGRHTLVGAVELELASALAMSCQMPHYESSNQALQPTAQTALLFWMSSVARVLIKLPLAFP